jgi:uncharacterized protein (DUF2236 family)
MSVIVRADLEASLAALRDDIDDPRHGILGPRSVAWHIGGDLAVFAGGGRAALLQLAHPMVAYAIDHHSTTRSDVLGRFQRTFRNVFAMVFGDLDDAFAAARRVHAIHTRVEGVIAQAVGSWRAGTPYHANDADALRWVHATLVDTTLVVRERLDGPLRSAIKDAYIVEMNRFAALFGIPRTMLPACYADHASYMARMLDSPAISVAPCAREMASFLMGRAPGPQPALGKLAERVTASMLPPRLVREFGLAGSRVASAGVWLATAAIGPVYRRLPSGVRGIPARSTATRRLGGLGPTRLAAWTERRLFGLSRAVTSAAARPAPK